MTLVHYNGSAWSRVTIPGPAINILGLACDGQGGLWLTGQDVHFASYALRRNRAGAWTRVQTSSAVFKLATIPGTTSMWGTGQQHNNAAVWVYGQIP